MTSFQPIAMFAGAMKALAGDVPGARMIIMTNPTVQADHTDLVDQADQADHTDQLKYHLDGQAGQAGLHTGPAMCTETVSDSVLLKMVRKLKIQSPLALEIHL